MLGMYQTIWHPSILSIILLVSLLLLEQNGCALSFFTFSLPFVTTQRSSSLSSTTTSSIQPSTKSTTCMNNLHRLSHHLLIGIVPRVHKGTMTRMMMSSTSDNYNHIDHHDDDLNPESIAQRLSKTLIQNNLKHNVKLSIAIAGGGSSAITTLTSTNNSSSIFVTSSVLYDRYSFADYVSSAASAGVSLRSLTSLQSHNHNDDNVNNNSFKIYSDRSGLFKYSSSYSSLLLAYTSLQSTIQYSKPFLSSTTAIDVDYNNYLGVGCTSTLVSQSKEDRNSKIYVTIMNGFGVCVRYDVVLDNGLNCDDDNDNINMSIRRRNRVEEDKTTGAITLWCIHHYLGVANQNNDNRADDNSTLEQILNRKGDSISISKNEILQSDHGTTVVEATQYVISENDNENRSSGDRNAKVVMLAPNLKSEKVEPTLQTIIPSNPIIFPGSFNPVHIGHVSLAKAAMKTMSDKMKTECEAYSLKMMGNKGDNDIDHLQNVWDTTEYLSLSNSNQGQQLCPVLFEMSLTNPDKPSMDPMEVSRRVEFFNDMMKKEAQNNKDLKEDCNNFDTMPKHLGILLTSAPLFVDKVRLLRKYLAPSAASYHYDNVVGDKLDKGKRIRLMTFVIGTDTLVRIINPKYYGDNVDNMLKAVREMGDLGAHFVVGGRLEQTKGDTDETKKFVSGESELVGLPKDVRDMFTIIKEEDFRVDISSTQVRARMAKDKK